MQSLDRNRVPFRALTSPDVLVVPQSLPVHLHHGAHLTVEEAVGQTDEESLEGEKNIPGEDEDCLWCCLWVRGSHYGYQVCDAEERDDDYQCLHCSQVNILCLTMFMGS